MTTDIRAALKEADALHEDRRRNVQNAGWGATPRDWLLRDLACAGRGVFRALHTAGVRRTPNDGVWAELIDAWELLATAPEHALAEAGVTVSELREAVRYLRGVRDALRCLAADKEPTALTKLRRWEGLDADDEPEDERDRQISLPPELDVTEDTGGERAAA